MAKEVGVILHPWYHCRVKK